MSMNPENVTFNVEKYDANKKIQISVDTNIKLGTVIYVESKDKAYICSEDSNKYNITKEEFGLPSVNTLNPTSYYVVINNNPCATEAKKFFDCSTTTSSRLPSSGSNNETIASQLKPITVTHKEKMFTPGEQRSVVSSKSPNPASTEVESNIIAQIERFSEDTIKNMFKTDIDVSVIPEKSNCLLTTKVSLNSIFNLHYDRQKNIVDSFNSNTDLSNKIGLLHKYINGLYNYVNNMVNASNVFKLFYTEYSKIISSLNISESLDRLKFKFRKIISDKFNNPNLKSPNKPEKLPTNYVYNDLIITMETISMIPNLIKKHTTDKTLNDTNTLSENNIDKIKYILMTVVNNLFYILLFNIIDTNFIDVDVRTPSEIFNVKVNDIPIRLSQINNFLIKKYIMYYEGSVKSGEQKYYYSGIDTSILDELEFNWRSLSCDTVTDKDINGYKFNKIEIRGKYEFPKSGGGRKTKKHRSKLTKQSRKTKRQFKK